MTRCVILVRTFPMLAMALALHVLPMIGGCASVQRVTSLAPPTVALDPSIRPAINALPVAQGEPPRPVAAVADAGGNQAEFVENELILMSDDRDVVAAFAARWSGTIVATFVPTEHSLTGERILLVRIGIAKGDLSRLQTDLQKLNPDRTGALRVSSQAGLHLLAAAAREASDGLTVGINFVHRSASMRDRNINESATGDKLILMTAYTEDYSPNPFNWSYFKSGGQQNIGVAEAWRALDLAGRLGNKVKIAIIDGGFADGSEYPAETEANTASVWAMDPTRANENTCTGGSTCPWHGMNVAEACMGQVNNGNGAAGPAGPVARALLIRRSADIFNNITAIGVAATSGANIVNMSFSAAVPATLSWSVKPFDLVTARMRGAGKLLFASAGNENRDIDKEDCFDPCPIVDCPICWESAWHTPVENSGVIGVGALDANSRTRRPDSNYGGKELDIWGPGHVWVGPDPEKSRVHLFGGTSAASPFVAGVAALIWSANPGLTADDVERILMDTANKGGPGEAHRWPNAYEAVVRALGSAPPEVKILPSTGPIPTFVGTPEVLFEATAFDREDGVPVVTWTSDRDGMIGTGLSFKRKLSPGTHLIVAMARDSFGMEVRDTKTIVAGSPREPGLRIDAPMNSQHFFAGQTIIFRAWGYDYSAGADLPDAAFRWDSQISGLLGTGHVVSKALPQGQHIITLGATDSAGAAGATQILVNIDPAPPGGRIPPTVQIDAIYPGDRILFEGYSNSQPYVNVALQAKAFDSHGQLLEGDSLTWSTNLLALWRPYFGNTTGRNVLLTLYSSSPTGITHKIMVTATDTNGNSASASRDITLVAPPR